MRVIACLATALVSTAALGAEVVKVYADDFLHSPLVEAARLFDEERGVRVEFAFGASGALRDRLMKHEAADLFIASDKPDPESLVAAGLATQSRLLAHNHICAYSREALRVTPGNVLTKMLDPSIRLGTAPKADLMGTYAWRVFERAEQFSPGALAQLSAKAVQLSGGPARPTQSDAKFYADLLTGKHADMLLAYCSIGMSSLLFQGKLEIAPLPPFLEGGPEFRIVTMRAASAPGVEFRDFLLGRGGLRVFLRAGYQTLP